MEPLSVATAFAPATAHRRDRRVWKLQWLTPARCRLLFIALLVFGFVGHIRYLTHDCPVDLSGDEAQYWDWSRQLDLSYYSKGPLVAYLIRASCALFGHDTMLAVRFPAIVLAMGTSTLTYLLARKLFGSDRLALGTVLLYHVVPMFVAGSILMTIDPPFFFCWALATYLAAHAILDDRRRLWLLVGMAVGIGFLAKYAMFLWFVPAFIMLATDQSARRQLRSPWPWAAVGVALLFLTPVLVWNARHGWVSLHHVATQTGANSAGGFRLRNVLEFIGAQLGIIGPGMFVMMTAGVVYAFTATTRGAARGGASATDGDAAASGADPARQAMRFLAWFGIVYFAINFLSSFRTKVQPNWPAPAYFTLMILVAYFIGTRLRSPETWRPWRWWFYPTIVVGLLLMPIAHNVEILFPAFRWFNDRSASLRAAAKSGHASATTKWLAHRLPKDGLDGRNVDFTVKLKGWQELGGVLSQELEHLGPGAFVLCDDYQQTAETAFYLRGQPKTFYAGTYYHDDPKRMTQYDLWPDRTLAAPNPRIGCNAIYLGHVDGIIPDLAAAFERVEGVPAMRGHRVAGRYVQRPVQGAIEVPIVRDGIHLQTFRYFRCYGFKGMTRVANRTTY